MISDSRCPKNITCVRAGEARVFVVISKKGKLIEKKELFFHASVLQDSKSSISYKSEDIQISGIGLFPYPKKPNKILNNEYCLELKLI